VFIWHEPLYDKATKTGSAEADPVFGSGSYTGKNQLVTNNCLLTCYLEFCGGVGIDFAGQANLFKFGHCPIHSILRINLCVKQVLKTEPQRLKPGSLMHLAAPLNPRPTRVHCQSSLPKCHAKANLQTTHQI